MKTQTAHLIQRFAVPLFLAVAIVAGGILFAPWHADVRAAEGGGDVVELTLEDALRLALEYDVDHEIARLNWENARIDNLIAQATGPASPYESLQRELQERRAENTYVTARNNVMLGVVQEYFDLKQAEHQANIAERQLAMARQELEVVRQMVRIGERHAQDELREENRVASSELSAETARRSYENRAAALRHRLGLDEDIRLVLVDEPSAPPFDWTLEETLAYALENSFSAWEREMNLRIARMDFDALQVQDPAPLQLEKAQNSLRITELNALESDRSFRNSVTTAYYNVVDAARRLASDRVDHELSEAEFESARRQHEAGLTTDAEWERARLDRLNADQSLRDSIASYMRARLDLFHLIGRPLDLLPDEEMASL